MQLGGVRDAVPWPVVEHLAAQLGIEDPSVVKRYTERPKTAYEHAWEIRDAYGYRPFWARATALSSSGRVLARVEIFSAKMRVTPAAVSESGWGQVDG